MRHKLFTIACFIACLVLPVADGAKAGEQWKLINEDPAGNLLYLDEGSLEALPEPQVLKVTMRFELRKSETKMFFVDAVDCRQARIKRLSLRMLNPVCTGDGETYSTSFEGRWDAISEGIEQKLFQAVCR